MVEVDGVMKPYKELVDQVKRIKSYIITSRLHLADDILVDILRSRCRCNPSISSWFTNIAFDQAVHELIDEGMLAKNPHNNRVYSILARL